MIRNSVTPRHGSFCKVPLSAPRSETSPKLPLRLVTALQPWRKRRGSFLRDAASGLTGCPTATELRSKFAWPVAAFAWRCPWR